MESFQNKCQNGKTDIKQIISQATGDQKNSLVLLAQVSYQNQIFQQGVLRPSWLHGPMNHRPNLSERLRFIIYLPPPLPTEYILAIEDRIISTMQYYLMS